MLVITCLCCVTSRKGRKRSETRQKQRRILYKQFLRRYKTIEETKEIWKDIIIEGFEGLYQASNLGNIKSLQRTYWTPAHGGHYKTDPERLLKPSLVGTFTKYKYVVFANNNYRKKFLVHRLVYEAFNGKIPEGYTIDHIDQNPQNNNIDNLQCITKQENIKKSNNHSARPQKSYLVIDTETGQEQKFVNAEAASEFLGVSSAHVRTTARGKATTNLIGGRYKVKTIPLIT